MKAVVYSEPRKFDVKDIPYPKFKDNQVIIKVKACGVCKTDLHIHNGSFISQFPLTNGHEFSGVIEELGSAVTAFAKGDRVVADNTVLCGECYYCRRNQPLFCENFYSLGVTGPGGFAEYVAVNQDKVFEIKNLSFEQATMVEPTSCVVHGMNVIDVQCGDDVLLFGAGPTGLILGQAIKHGGAGRLVVADPNQFKLDLSKELGADDVILVDRKDRAVHEKEINSKYPKGFDIVIDASGVAEIAGQAIKFTKYGAKVIFYGVCDERDRIQISPYEVFRKEIKIIGSFAQTHCFEQAINLLENGTIKIDKLITHKFNLDEYGKALDVLVNEKNKMKVIIVP
jgi:D-arabinitol dehydrogenase (NADP+)